ncbi:nitroreductase [Polymorphospora sp. NPDC051019]|uniref:Acg family FMN-binding oxidoreductase n=1 Tax=Polymorphospora sp. NPDC051019 TaxID=3155725 RepID=UPI0034367295
MFEPVDLPDSATAQVLATAAWHALRAPSALNTQPWRWRAAARTLELRADPGRRLGTTDRDGRLLHLACGAALHHAYVALLADGWQVRIALRPDPAGDPELLARITLIGRGMPGATATALRDAIGRRRTDRRAFADTPVPAVLLDRLRRTVELHGTYLHLVRPDQLPMLAIATASAAADELADPDYRAELIRWTTRPAGSGDGVPAASAVRQAPRRVPVRDHTIGHHPAGLDVGAGTDRGASYGILFGSTDEPEAWLRAGEALSALLLTATDAGLAAAVLSDPVEREWPRHLLGELLSAVGTPYLAVRIGLPVEAAPLPATPRRDPADVIEISG